MAGSRCSFAAEGTYGHECGKPATLAGAKPSTHTVSGVFWALRCDLCIQYHGRDNRGIESWEPLDESKHVNEWK